MSEEVAQGTRTSLDALAHMGNVAASFGTDGETFVNDLGSVLSRTEVGNLLPNLGDAAPVFDGSGFRGSFNDGSNQVRHFSAALVVGAAHGSFGGALLNTGREAFSRGFSGSMADVRMGNAAASLGAGLASGRVAPSQFSGIVRRQFGGR